MRFLPLVLVLILLRCLCVFSETQLQQPHYKDGEHFMHFGFGAVIIQTNHACVRDATVPVIIPRSYKVVTITQLDVTDSNHLSGIYWCCPLGRTWTVPFRDILAKTISGLWEPKVTNLHKKHAGVIIASVVVVIVIEMPASEILQTYSILFCFWCSSILFWWHGRIFVSFVRLGAKQHAFALAKQFCVVDFCFSAN